MSKKPGNCPTTPPDEVQPALYRTIDDLERQLGEARSERDEAQRDLDEARSDRGRGACGLRLNLGHPGSRGV